MNRWKNFKNGFIKENPVFGLYLGLCSALAISSTLDNAVGMGFSVIVVLVFSNVIISAIRNIVPDEIRIPVFIVVIATLVTIVQMLLEAYAVDLYGSLGVFIGLIVVNCIILGRAEAFASKNGVVDSALDGLGMGLGYTFALVLIAVTRELIATASLTLSNPFTSTIIFKLDLSALHPYSISMFGTSTGAFFTFAVFSALFAGINAKRQAKEDKE